MNFKRIENSIAAVTTSQITDQKGCTFPKKALKVDAQFQWIFSTSSKPAPCRRENTDGAIVLSCMQVGTTTLTYVFGITGATSKDVFNFLQGIIRESDRCFRL